MAEKLAKLYGTEDDKVNCPFYYKIGACRYEHKCMRIHNRPPYSQTILLKHMYENTPIELAIASGNQVSEEDTEKAISRFEEFYQEIYLELSNYGEIEEICVCDNIGDHMLGNVYVKFVNEKDAIKCMESVRNRYYDSKLLMPEYSPITDFSNAKCKQFIEGCCKRGGYCNYMHLKPISEKFKNNLIEQVYTEHPEWRVKKKKEKKSHKKHKHRSRSKSRSKSKSRKHSKKHKKTSHKSSKKNSRSRSVMNSEERRRMIQEWNVDEEQEKVQINSLQHNFQQQ